MRKVNTVVVNQKETCQQVTQCRDLGRCGEGCLEILCRLDSDVNVSCGLYFSIRYLVNSSSENPYVVIPKQEDLDLCSCFCRVH